MANQVENSKPASAEKKSEKGDSLKAQSAPRPAGAGAAWPDTESDPTLGAATSGGSADDLLAQLAGAEVDRLLKEAESQGGLEVQETAQQRPLPPREQHAAQSDPAAKPKRTSMRTIPMPVPLAPQAAPTPASHPPAAAATATAPPTAGAAASQTVAQTAPAAGPDGQYIAGGNALERQEPGAITGEKFQPTVVIEPDALRDSDLPAAKINADVQALQAILEDAAGESGASQTSAKDEEAPDQSASPAADADAQPAATADARAAEDFAAPVEEAAPPLVARGQKTSAREEVAAELEKELADDDDERAAPAGTLGTEREIATTAAAAEWEISHPQSVEQYIERATSTVEQELADSLAETLSEPQEAEAEVAPKEETDPAGEDAAAADARTPWWVRILQWINAPVADDRVREIVGKVALITFFNAMAILIYVLLFHHKH